MKKKAAHKETAPVAKGKSDDIASLMTEVRSLIQSARRGVASVVDTLQVMTNFEIGRRIVEHEQQGEARAAYGKEMIKELSERLTEEFGRGFSMSNLASMRAFYLIWSERIPIFQQPTGKLSLHEKSQQATGQLSSAGKEQQAADELEKSRNPFTLSWTHYVVLLTVKDPDERSFYEIEATHEGWSVPELKRQKASSLYERLALSRDKEGIRNLAREGQVITKPEDLLKEPLVLEFLGLEERTSYSESDLEQSIIFFTLPPDANIHAREYKLYLPSKELLKKKLLEWTREEESKR